MEEIGAGAFSKSAPWSVDLSEAVNLKTIAPDAFPFASPWGDDQCYIFVANEAVLAKMPTTFPARIFTRVVQIDRSTPIASVQIRAAQGKDIERILPGIGSYAEGRVVGMDVGDGKIRLLALSSLRYSSNEPSYYGARSMQWLRSAVADPEIKIYGTDFDCFRSPWAVVTQLDLLRATQLKKIDLLYIPQSLLPDLASYPNLERLSLSKISGLERLDLSHTPLKGLEISSCDTLQAVILPPSGLERLSITRCKKLTQIDEAPLASVKELNLSYNALGGTLNLSGAKHLKEVDLSSNQLTELTIDNPLLTDLKCSRNQLKAIHTPTTREAFQGVRSVAIASNRIQESELNRLYTALPDLKEETTAGKLTLLSKIATTEQDNNAYASDLSIAREKNWKFYDLNGQEMTSMIVKADTLVSWNNATGTVIIPDGVEFIAVNAYRGQTAVTALQFPSSLRRIGQYAFSRTGITSMPSLEGITEIHPGAFLRCTSLAGALNVPSSVTLLGEKAFAHCSSLTSASIEASIGSVPNFLFDGCDALNEVSMGSTIVTCNLFWGHSQPYEKPTAPQKLILHAPVKAQYRICAPQGSRDPRKTLDVYVPAPLLEEYKNRDHYESAYSFAYDNYTYYAMESSATEATVTITQVAGCTIVVKNGEQEIPSGSSLPIGTKLTIYAQLESGKLLKKFFFNGANMGSINRYDLTLTEPMTFSAEVVATFTQIPEYVVRFTSTGHGHLTATKNGEPFTSGSLARKNDKLVITAHPDAGYNVDKWLLGSEEIELSVYTGRTVFETTVGEAEVIVKTTFVAKTFPVTVAESPNGKATVSGYDDLTAVPYGTRLMVTATPDEGYTLHKITANGQDITDAKSFEVKEATTIQAEFVEQIKTFPVTVAESPNGKVTVSGYDDLTAVPYGTRLTVTATPDEGYTLHKITANGQDITNAKSFEVKEATTIQAEFNKDTALEEVTTEQIVLYPNPAKDMVFLTGGMAYAPVAIYSLEGVCLLLTETDAEGKACIHVEGLVEGAYLVKIGAKSFPLIVVH